MPDFDVYRPLPEEPAEATLRAVTPTGPWTGLNAQRFEFVSRGDFVPGILYLPDSPSNQPAPLLLLQHGVSQGMDSEALAFTAPWVEQGLALAAIDLPLHGERSSPKLSERLVLGVGQLSKGLELDAETRALVEEFARQTTSDLIRTLDALSALESVDGDRIGFMGFDLGAVAGSYLLAHDPRLRAAVLASVGGGRGSRDLDPATYLARATGSSLLIVSAQDDDRESVSASDVLFNAAPEPKEHLRFKGNPQTLPEETHAEIWRFLSKALGL